MKRFSSSDTVVATKILPASSQCRSTESTLYRPLDRSKRTFRLLGILPGSEDSPIKCTMLEASIDQSEYCGVSYAWGPALPSRTIRVNDYTAEVRENLYQFLVAHRKKQEPLPLWIDAICINQDSVTERNIKYV